MRYFYLNLITIIFSRLRKKFSIFNTENTSKFVFYKIVDILSESEFLLQCKNSKCVFKIELTELVFDLSILHRLHPIQACFVGIEYSLFLKKNNLHLDSYKKQIHDNISDNDSELKISYQDRKGNICYINTKTKESFITDPRDLALSKNLINKFNSEQAFFVGICAGLKINCTNNRKAGSDNIVYLKNNKQM